MPISKLSRSGGVSLKGLSSLNLITFGNVVGILGAQGGGSGGRFGCLPGIG